MCIDHSLGISKVSGIHSNSSQQLPTKVSVEPPAKQLDVSGRQLSGAHFRRKCG
jgi:hypothetical protein